MIGNVDPFVPENTAQSHVHKVPGIKCLGGHVEDCHHAADEDPEQRAAQAGRYAHKSGETDVVARRTACVEEYQEAADDGPDNRGQENVPPEQSDAHERGASVCSSA